MEFVTYLYTMVIFAGFVLSNDDNSLDWAEIIFAAYICVSATAYAVFACVSEEADLSRFCFTLMSKRSRISGLLAPLL